MKFRKKTMLKTLAITSGLASIVAVPILSTSCSTGNQNNVDNSGNQENKPSINNDIDVYGKLDTISNIDNGNWSLKTPQQIIETEFKNMPNKFISNWDKLTSAQKNGATIKVETSQDTKDFGGTTDYSKWNTSSIQNIIYDSTSPFLTIKSGNDLKTQLSNPTTLEKIFKAAKKGNDGSAYKLIDASKPYYDVATSLLHFNIEETKTGNVNTKVNWNLGIPASDFDYVISSDKITITLGDKTEISTTSKDDVTYDVGIDDNAGSFTNNGREINLQDKEITIENVFESLGWIVKTDVIKNNFFNFQLVNKKEGDLAINNEKICDDLNVYNVSFSSIDEAQLIKINGDTKEKIQKYKIQLFATPRKDYLWSNGNNEAGTKNRKAIVTGEIDIKTNNNTTSPDISKKTIENTTLDNEVYKEIEASAKLIVNETTDIETQKTNILDKLNKLEKIKGLVSSVEISLKDGNVGSMKTATYKIKFISGVKFNNLSSSTKFKESDSDPLKIENKVILETKVKTEKTIENTTLDNEVYKEIEASAKLIVNETTDIETQKTNILDKLNKLEKIKGLVSSVEISLKDGNVGSMKTATYKIKFISGVKFNNLSSSTKFKESDSDPLKIENKVILETKVKTEKTIENTTLDNEVYKEIEASAKLIVNETTDIETQKTNILDKLNKLEKIKGLVSSIEISLKDGNVGSMKTATYKIKFISGVKFNNLSSSTKFKESDSDPLKIENKVILETKVKTEKTIENTTLDNEVFNKLTLSASKITDKVKTLEQQKTELKNTLNQMDNLRNLIASVEIQLKEGGSGNKKLCIFKIKFIDGVKFNNLTSSQKFKQSAKDLLKIENKVNLESGDILE